MNTLRNAKALALQDVALTSGLLPRVAGEDHPASPLIGFTAHCEKDLLGGAEGADRAGGIGEGAEIEFLNFIIVGLGRQ